MLAHQVHTAVSCPNMPAMLMITKDAPQDCESQAHWHCIEQNGGAAGSGRQAAPSKAAIGAAGASLLYHMDAQPDASRAAWQFSNPDGEASRADNDMQNGHSVNGAHANRVSGSSDRSGWLKLPFCINVSPFKISVSNHDCSSQCSTAVKDRKLPIDFLSDSLSLCVWAQVWMAR